MELILQPSLPHQQKAVDAIADVFHKTTIEPPSVYYATPQITTYIDGVGANIKNIQDANGLSVEYKGYS